MKNTIIICLLFISSLAFSQTWTAKQLSAANTESSNTTLSKLEKDIILYINLARLYPKDFVKFELKNYSGSSRYNEDLSKSTYKASLIAQLNSMVPVGALKFDSALYVNAKCLAQEQSKNGKVGHERTKCKDASYAECCSYGMDTGKDVVMQWLIDEKTPSLGHRKNCLGKQYTKIGVCATTHKVYSDCAVADFR